MDPLYVFAVVGPAVLCAVQALFSYLLVKSELESGKPLLQVLKTVRLVYLMLNALGWVLFVPAAALVSFTKGGMGGPEAATGVVAALFLGAPAGFVVGLVLGGFTLLGSAASVLPEAPEHSAKEHAVAVSKGVFFWSVASIALVVLLMASWRTFLSPH